MTYFSIAYFSHRLLIFHFLKLLSPTDITSCHSIDHIALTMLSQPFGYNKRSMPLFGRSGLSGSKRRRRVQGKVRKRCDNKLLHCLLFFPLPFQFSFFTQGRPKARRRGDISSLALLLMEALLSISIECHLL